MRDSFSRKLVLVILAAFAAACLLYFYRHFIQEAIYENSNEGWREMFKPIPAPKRP